MRRVNPPFPELLIEMLLDEDLLIEANLLNREELDAFVAQAASLVTDPAQQKWFTKVLPGFLLKSAPDARRATPEDVPENPPAWMAKAPAGTAYDVFKASAETSQNVKAVADYLNANPTALTGRSTWEGVLKAATEADRVAAGNDWTYEQHRVLRAQATPGETVYTITPTVRREGWATIHVHVQSRSKNVKEVKGYEVHLPNSTELRAIAYKLMADEGVNFNGGSMPVAQLKGDYVAHLLVSDGSRDWTGVLMKNCIGGGTGSQYDKGCSCYAISHARTGDMVMALELRDGRWAQQLTVGNQQLTPQLRSVFDEFAANPGSKVQKLDLTNGRTKLSTELADGDALQGTLNLEGVPLESIAAISVTGDLVLKGTPLTTLPAGLTVGGKLDIRNTAITSVPEGVKFGGLRATFGKIDHDWVCDYVTSVLHARALATDKFKEWLRNDPVLGPMSDKERQASSWVQNIRARTQAAVTACDWKSTATVAGQTQGTVQEAAKLLKTIYAQT